MGKSAPPCVALRSKRCHENPSDPNNQYKLVPDKFRTENHLEENASVCRSPLCWAFVGLIEPKQASGRPPKRSREDVTIVAGQLQQASGPLRQKPQIIEKIIQVKAPRFSNSLPRLDHAMLNAPLCLQT